MDNKMKNMIIIREVNILFDFTNLYIFVDESVLNYI